MTGICAGELTKAVGGRLLNGEESQLVEHISLDSRNMEGNDLFVPVIGERVDAHLFICQAIANGASAVFTSRQGSKEDVCKAIEQQCQGRLLWEEKARKAAWIHVEDTKMALQAFGTYCRRLHPIPLIGITGSVGKTTTREMVAAALSAGFEVYKTPGNSNSQVGVPITIAQIPDSAQIGVIELGMSEPGEMERIARVAQVNCALMTNIGIAHIEQLGSQENILKEKLHIQRGMAADGVLFLNGDDPLLRQVLPEEGRRRVLYGFSGDCDYRAEELRLEEGYPVFMAVHGRERVCVHLHVIGRHMVLNALAALAVAGEYHIPMEAAAGALEQFGGLKGRQLISKAAGVTLIDDSYNASPVSMKAGLDVLSCVPCTGRRIAVLADMKELGPDTEQFHREIGYYLAEHPADEAALLGTLAAEIGKGLKERGCRMNVREFTALEELEGWLAQEVRSGDCLLFKGSNSMRLSHAVAELTRQLTEAIV